MQVDGSGRDGRWWRLLAAGALSLGLALGGVAVAGPASAQTGDDCDPFYGCDPDDPDDTVEVTCTVTGEVFVAGDDGAVLVSGAPAGAAIAVTLDGTVVGNGTATADGDATIAFVVPEGTTPGSHTLFVQGAGFGADCGTIQVDAVLSGTTEQGGAGGDASGEAVRGSGGNRSLARTGIELATYLAVALVLLVVGHRLVLVARRRHRRAVRRENAVASLARD